MYKVFKYDILSQFYSRIGVILAVFVINITFIVLGSNNIYGEGWKTFAVTISSGIIVWIFIVSIMQAEAAYKSVFQAPLAYNTMLVPVKRWKILLSKIITVILYDLITWSLAITGLVWVSLILSGHGLESGDLHNAFWNAIIIIANYLFLLALIFFVGAVTRSLFFARKIGKFLGFITFIVSLYALSLLDISLFAVARVERVNIFFFVQIMPGFNLGMIMYLALCIIKAAIVLIAASALIERRINV
jgi:hypothetical protein